MAVSAGEHATTFTDTCKHMRAKTATDDSVATNLNASIEDSVRDLNVTVDRLLTRDFEREPVSSGWAVAVVCAARAVSITYRSAVVFVTPQKASTVVRKTYEVPASLPATKPYAEILVDYASDWQAESKGPVSPCDVA